MAHRDVHSPGSDGQPTSALIREELGLILRSESFRVAGRTSQLLTYLVDQTLLGRSDELKEYVVGVEVFGKHAQYDPHSDSIVRVQAGRLRVRLCDYYVTEGRNDPVLIDLSPGSYTPTFRFNPLLPERQPAKRGWWSLVSARPAATIGLVLLAILLCVAAVLGFQQYGNSADRVAKAAATAQTQIISPHNSETLNDSLGFAERAPKLSSYEAAVQRYPDSGPAWAALANSYSVLAFLTDTGRQEFPRKAAQAATRALALDPQSAEGHAVLGWLDFYYGWNWGESEGHFREAASLKPGCDICNEWQALVHAALGKSSDAIAEADTVARRTSASYFAAVTLATVLYYGGRFADAEKEAGFAVSLDAADGTARAILIASLVGANRPRSVFSVVPLPNPAEPSQDVLTRYICAYGRSGDAKGARLLLRALEQRAVQGQAWFSNLAAAYAGLGDRERALDALQTALEKREPDLVFMAVEPEYGTLRTDARFAEIQTATAPARLPRAASVRHR